MDNTRQKKKILCDECEEEIENCISFVAVGFPFTKKYHRECLEAMLNEDRWYDSFVTRYRVRLESKETERFWAFVSFLLGIAMAIIFGWWVLKYQTPENGSPPVFQMICASFLGFVLGAWIGIAYLCSYFRWERYLPDPREDRFIDFD